MLENRRRRFLAGALGVFLAPRIDAQPQEGQQHRIGVMIPFVERDVVAQLQVAAFRDQLAKLGRVEERNVRFIYRWGASDVARMASTAKDLVALKPDVILARTTPVTAALRKETQTIPIVFVVVSDPVGDGLARSLGRPGGNVTGFTNVESSFGSKWLELLRDVFPRLSRVAVMYGPKTAPGGGKYYWQLVEAAARASALDAQSVPIQGAEDIQRAMPALQTEKPTALIVTPDVTTLSNHRLIVSLALNHRLPTVYPWAVAPEAGGLMSYGVEYLDLYRRAAGYVDQILRGASPGDLPIQQPTTFELVINLGAAKTLGLTVPQHLMLRADRVIH